VTSATLSRQHSECFANGHWAEAALDACAEGIAVLAKGCLVYINPAFTRLLGRDSRRELLGRPVGEILPATQGCAQIESGSTPPERSGSCGYPSCSFTCDRPDGSRLWVEALCSRFEAAGEARTIIVARDITRRERRRVERDSERRFRAIFDAAAIGIGHCTLNGHMVEINRAMEQFLGYSADELRGMHIRKFTHEADVAQDESLFAELISGQRQSCQLEKRYIRKDRSCAWGRLTRSMVRGPGGEAEFVIEMVEDIGERKRAEQQLFAAQKMEAIGRLVGGVAHDFNNLLTGILLYCDLLLGNLPQGSRAHRQAEEIRAAGEQGAALIQQLMAVARKQVAEPEALSLNDIVRGMQNLLTKLIGEHIECIPKLEETAGRVKLDRAQAQQIVLNLVLNARDAMPKGGRVMVETAGGWLNRAAVDGSDGAEVPAVVLIVSDNGCGMDEVTKARLFEPFFTTKDPGRGSGLGLTTVHSIVTKAGGVIEIESQPGEGTRIVVRFPRLEDGGSIAPEEALVPLPGGVETILLVEDNSGVRKSAASLLKERGYAVLEAAAGAEGIRVASEYKGEIHLLLTDLMMPGMSGRELACQLKATRPAMSVLYMSGMHEAVSPGSWESDVVVVRKPFSSAALAGKVRQVLDEGTSTRSRKD
jgi:PAS domain S-box-containing protein